jgi:hypothetical protein
MMEIGLNIFVTCNGKSGTNIVYHQRVTYAVLIYLLKDSLLINYCSIREL